MSGDVLETSAESPVRASCVRPGVLALGGKSVLPDLAFSPAQVIAASVADLDGQASEWGGVYFLVWRRAVVYVGKGGPIWPRLNAHKREGRPHDAVAAISGLSKDAAATVEDCYVKAWQPPWNCAITRGSCRGRESLLARLIEMGKDGVSPSYPARGGAELSFMKSWELHVRGCLQHRG